MVINVKRKYCSWVVWNANLNKYQWKSKGKAAYIRFYSYIRKVAHSDWEAARECIYRTSHSTWWEWDQVSRPFFWRWSKEYLDTIRDGIPPWIISTPEKGLDRKIAIQKPNTW